MVKKMNFGSDNSKSILSDVNVEAILDILGKGEGVVFTCDRSTSLAGEKFYMYSDCFESCIEFSIFNGKRLIIHRVLLSNRDRGLFTSIVSYLTRCLEGTAVNIFEVESVLTPEMKSWCRKYDLEVSPGMISTEDGLGINYRCNMKNLYAYFGSEL